MNRKRVLPGGLDECGGGKPFLCFFCLFAPQTYNTLNQKSTITNGILRETKERRSRSPWHDGACCVMTRSDRKVRLQVHRWCLRFCVVLRGQKVVGHHLFPARPKTSFLIHVGILRQAVDKRNNGSKIIQRVKYVLRCNGKVDVFVCVRKIV